MEDKTMNFREYFEYFKRDHCPSCRTEGQQ